MRIVRDYAAAEAAEVPYYPLSDSSGADYSDNAVANLPGKLALEREVLNYCPLLNVLNLTKAHQHHHYSEVCNRIRRIGDVNNTHANASCVLVVDMVIAYGSCRDASYSESVELIDHLLRKRCCDDIYCIIALRQMSILKTRCLTCVSILDTIFLAHFLQVRLLVKGPYTVRKKLHLSCSPFFFVSLIFPACTSESTGLRGRRSRSSGFFAQALSALRRPQAPAQSPSRRSRPPVR